jgi:hypothetical protein
MPTRRRPVLVAGFTDDDVVRALGRSASSGGAVEVPLGVFAVGLPGRSAG